MGYCVPEHVAALARLGPTIHHRRSFSPVTASYAEAADVETHELAPDVLPL